MSTCDSKVELIEYYVSDVKYCQQHGRAEIPTEEDYSVFGALKRCFMCKSYEPLPSPDDVEEKMLVTIVECHTHPEPTSQCLHSKGQSRRERWFFLHIVLCSKKSKRIFWTFDKIIGDHYFIIFIKFQFIFIHFTIKIIKPSKPLIYLTPQKMVLKPLPSNAYTKYFIRMWVS